MVTRLQVKVKTFFKEMQEMPENTQQNPSDSDSIGHGPVRRSPFVALLGVLLGFESLLVLSGALYFLSRIFLETPDNFSGALVIFAITLLIAIGLIATTIGTFRAQPWTRGAILTWQIMQFVVATSFIQGIAVWQPVGWVLAVFAVVTTVLLFSKPFIGKMSGR